MPFVKLLELKNEIEAQLLQSLLEERKIPHAVKRYANPALGGFFQTEFGWGCLEGAPEDAEAIRALYDDIKAATVETDNETVE
jgi:hypothetical protein